MKERRKLGITVKQDRRLKAHSYALIEHDLNKHLREEKDRLYRRDCYKYDLLRDNEQEHFFNKQLPEKAELRF